MKEYTTLGFLTDALNQLSPRFYLKALQNKISQVLDFCLTQAKACSGHISAKSLISMGTKIMLIQAAAANTLRSGDLAGFSVIECESRTFDLLHTDLSTGIQTPPFPRKLTAHHTPLCDTLQELIPDDECWLDYTFNSNDKITGYLSYTARSDDKVDVQLGEYDDLYAVLPELKHTSTVVCGARSYDLTHLDLSF